MQAEETKGPAGSVAHLDTGLEEAIEGTTQPLPPAEALGRFAHATVTLAGSTDDSALGAHLETIASLTDCDLALLYETGPDSDRLELVAHSGLPADMTPEFAQLGPDRTGNVDSLQPANDGATHLLSGPVTTDLHALGIRASWTCPLRLSGLQPGQIYFGSRRWDRFHPDVVSVFAAAAVQVTQALERRRSTRAAPAWDQPAGAVGSDRSQQFIAVLAHELRNPIAPIRTGLDLLSTEKLDEEARRGTIAMIQRQTAHLVRLIDDLLDSVRLETGRLQVKRQPELLKHVVRSAIESIRPALSAKRQALRLDDAAADVVVDVDPVRLAQAFVNILSANVRSTPVGGCVAVSVEIVPAGLTVAFEDEGSDVEAARTSVSGLFQASARAKSDAGLGIGLALVRGLVELNEGHIDVRANPHKPGATFTVTLPYVPDAVTETPNAPVDPADWQSHRVLIVDDNRDAAETLGLLFEFDGHTIRLAHDGPSAVAEAATFQPEVILMDVGIPVFSGTEATRRIRTLESPVRPFIIALTGWGAAADRQATLAAGCDLHLTKPVAHKVLRRTITELMSGTRGEHGDD